jgi:superfamily II DNA or RNA helicase
MNSPHPEGLHVHLVAVGPTLRFVVWFERAMPPDLFATFKRSPSEVPFRHPALVPFAECVSRFPKGAQRVWITPALPRLGSYLPTPLPGLITAWDLPRFKGGRSMARALSGVEAAVIPPAYSIHPLRRLIHDHAARHGQGFVSPAALALLEPLDALRQRLAEGPLLPTLTFGPSAWDSSPRPPASPVREADAATGWVPPWTVRELCHLWHRLSAIDGLPAPLYERRSYAHGEREGVETWAQTSVPSRLAVFLSEVFAASAAAAGATPESTLAVEHFRAKGPREEIAALHRDLGSCLFPDHPIFTPPAAAREELRVAVSPPSAGNAWGLELGLTIAGKGFLPLSALLADGTFHDPLVEHDGAVWWRPGDVLRRGWQLLAKEFPEIARRPELLADGRGLVPEALAMELLRLNSLRGSVRLNGEEFTGRDESYFHYGRTTVSFGARQDGGAQVRVRWDVLGDGDDPSLHAARFTATLHVAVGDHELLAADAERLLKESQEAFLRVDERVIARSALEAALELVRAREKVLARLGGGKGLPWARTVELDDEWSSEHHAIATEVRFARRWEEFLARLRDGKGVPPRRAPTSFQGELRPYQERGLAWMSFLVDNGFGGCLADDMGLGKTVQVLALLAARRERRPDGHPDLVVAPTAVVLNWQREARRFTPKLRVYAHQGAGRALTAADLLARRERSDVVVTSFALARRDRELFEAVPWGAVIIDEAQNLKNPDALQTRAIAALPSEARLALTGTPVENNLRDLWSIYHVVLPGLLGGATRFGKTFMTPLRQGDGRAMDKLTRRVGPFLLRRVKGDPGIADELPPRQEQDVWCDLTREQVALYQAMTEATLRGVEDKAGIARRAHILTALMRFKQICNHPENFHRERPDALFGRSGKLDRVMEILAELVEGGQKTVVFTQFAEMGAILGRAIEDRLDFAPGFYHGGLNPKEREALIEDFTDPQGPPVLLLSLKAGGVGLNLQAASAVIHYDRWWNPAVEEQATGRAHRLGQTRSVNVYKFVTRATLEERIVAMIEQKRELAERVLGAADDSWITEMTDRDLRDFLTLDKGAGAVDDDPR